MEVPTYRDRLYCVCETLRMVRQWFVRTTFYLHTPVATAGNTDAKSQCVSVVARIPRTASAVLIKVHWNVLDLKIFAYGIREKT